MILKLWVLAILMMLPAPACQHQRQHGLAAGPGGIEVEAEAALPFGIAHRQRFMEDIGAGVIDQRGRRAELGHRLGDGALDVLGAGDVGRDEMRPAAILDDRSRRRSTGLGVLLGDGDGGTLGREAAGNGLADPPPGAR